MVALKMTQLFLVAKEWRNEFNDPWKYLWIDAWDGGDGCITELILMIAVYYIFSMQNGAIRRKFNNRKI